MLLACWDRCNMDGGGSLSADETDKGAFIRVAVVQREIHRFTWQGVTAV
ncbi:hypothetical protein KTH_11540 [Thermosporothrix hazakensis]|nr:hypothetical protein KTH_11540 [Thermosporothrix hazakensis]